MRAYCRPGATPYERLESHIAHLLCSRPEMSVRLADLLVWAARLGPSREAAVRAALPSVPMANPGEALGMARAALFFCGVTHENEGKLTGKTRGDLADLMGGRLQPPDLASPASYATSSLVEGYCFMGASFAKGMDRVFQAITGKPLADHLRRALALL